MNLTKSIATKSVAVAVGFALTLGAFMPSVAGAQSATDLQAQINSLLATIQALQAQLAAATGGSSSTGTGYTFNTNLTVGSTGNDVKELQKFLNMSADTKVSASGAGSPGNESTYFGPATRAALAKFQVKYGITPAAGYFGPITRAKVNSMNTGTGTGTTLPVGGGLSVMAGSQPANSLAPQSASRVPFTTVVLTAGASDVTVNSITVERAGLAQNAVFSGVVLLDSDGTQIGIAKTINSNNQVMVGEPFVVKAGTSKTVTVAGNMNSSLSTYAGQVAALNVVAVNTSATVSGSLPIMGANHTINASLTTGSATVQISAFDPGAAQSKEIGTTGYKFSGVRVTAGSAEQVRLFSVRFNQTGSASSQDLANVMVYVDGTAYPTTVSSDGKYYSANFSGGILIDKGLSKDIYIQGDIVGAGSSGRTVDFDIYRNTDIYLSGVTYGYGITPSGSGTGFSGGTPWYNGSIVTVTGGSATAIQKATSVASQNIAVNVPNQVLGGFTTDIKGEAISVQGMTFSFATGTGSGAGLLTSVTLVDENGAVVAGPVDATDVTINSNQEVTFTDTITLPVGLKTFTLKGKVPTGTGNGMTYIASTTPSNWSNITGQTTGNTITLSNGVFSMNTMTVKSAALAVSVSTAPASQNIVAGGQALTFANLQFDASQSGEDVRFSSLALTNGGSNTTSLSSCQLFDGSTALNTGSNVVNPDAAAETFTFDSLFVVPKGTVKTLTLKCNVASSATGTFIWGITGTQIGNITVTGVTSGASVTATGGTMAGQTMTVASGSLVVSADSSTPSYATVAAGSTGVTLGTYKFRATNESVNLKKVGLVLTSGSSSDVSTVYLYNGATLLGTATFTGSNTTATTSDFTLNLAKDTDVVLTIKGDLRAIGSSETGTQGQLVKVDVTNAEGNGSSSGSTLQVGGVTAGTAGVRMFKSFPTVAQDTLASTGVADGKLMRFKVTANSAGAVGLFNLNFTVATSSFATGGGVSAVKVMVYSDASYSLPVSGTYGAATGQFGSTATPDANAPTLNFTATTNALQIPAGVTYYFQVEATVASTQTGTSVTTTLNGDAAYLTTGVGTYQVATTTAALADSNNDFIWSGNATGTAVFSANDWANGYGILGLPSGGFSQTRSN